MNSDLWQAVTSVVMFGSHMAPPASGGTDWPYPCTKNLLVVNGLRVGDAWERGQAKKGSGWLDGELWKRRRRRGRRGGRGRMDLTMGRHILHKAVLLGTRYVLRTNVGGLDTAQVNEHVKAKESTKYVPWLYLHE